jgi:ABC-type phosphate transport system auxiliary subunit
MNRRWLNLGDDWIIDMTLLVSGALSIAFAVTVGVVALLR